MRLMNAGLFVKPCACNLSEGQQILQCRRLQGGSEVVEIFSTTTRDRLRRVGIIESEGMKRGSMTNARINIAKPSAIITI